MRVISTLLALLLAGCAPSQPDSATQSAPAPAGLRAPDVRYEPSPHEVVRQMLRLAKVGPGDVVYDLGSGDGRIPVAAVRDFKAARAVGIDIDPQRIAEATANAQKAGVSDRVTFRNDDLFEADFSEATVVTLFLYPDLNLKLRPRLLAELKPGTRVVSYWHHMGDWKPERTVPTDRAAIYFWTIPER